MKDLKTFLEQYKTEEGFDFDKANEELNNHINGIVAKNKPSEDQLIEKATSTVIEGLGIDAKSLDDVKTYIKSLSGNSDEFKETNLKLEKELNLTKKQMEELANQKAELENKFTVTEQQSKIMGLGVSEDNLDYVHFKVGKMVNEEKDFDTALKEFKEAHGNLFRKTNVSTNRKVYTPSTSTDGDLDITEAALKKLKK
jgi:hypothetical protein